MDEIGGGLQGIDDSSLLSLSETLGVEIYMVGVGDQYSLIPRQTSSPASVATGRGALADWIVACCTRPEEEPWWKHTHPEMSAFFSATDVEGAHNLFEAIKKPIRAIVLGKGGDKFEVVIDGEWIKSHPKPKFTTLSRYAYKSWDNYSYRQTDLWTPASRLSLREELEFLLTEHGWKKILKTLRKMARLVDDEDVASPYLVHQCVQCREDPYPSKFLNVCGKCGHFLPERG